MGARPVLPVRLPADLANVTPGKLPPGLLRPIRPYGHLHWLAADAYHAMRRAAFDDGVRPFKPTSAHDAYRPLHTQLRGFLARYTTDPIPNSKSIKMYNGKRWYLKPGQAPMLPPGLGFHPLGLAVDIWGASGDRLQWLEANAVSFGWSWEFTSGAEPWHLRYVVGDRIPARVQRWKDSHANGSNRRVN